MDNWERFFMASLMGKREIYWGSAAIGGIFFSLCGIATIIYGIASGYWQWCVVGGIWVLVFGIIAAVCIMLNIRKNSNRWDRK
jgi:hypothetical protein